mgnify:CR=1 FL=1
MFKTFIDFFKNRDIRKKIFFTLFILFIFRLGAAIPAPGINDTIIKLGSNSLLTTDVYILFRCWSIYYFEHHY